MIRFAENLNKMIAAGLGGAMEAPSTEVAVGHCIRYLEASGPVASFESNIAAPIRSLRVDMLPIQAGSGDPSPDNIRPISGRESVTVTRTGKNLFDLRMFAEEYPDYCTYDESTGELTVSTNADLYNTGVSVNIPLDVFNGGYLQYDAKNGKGARNFRFNIFYEDGTFFEPPGTGSQTGFVHAAYSLNPEKIVSVRMNWTTSGTVTIKNFCITQGTTATDYEPYDGQSVTIPLGQTVYGGTLDVVSGKLTVDTAIIASYNGEELPGEWLSDRDSYTPGTTPTTGAQVCYKLSIPVEFNIEPTTLSTLAGENNIWSDAGDVTLEYTYYEETEGY